jgi:hypothetical protein
MPFWFLLYFTANRTSTDSRDKIYALYGVLHHDGRGKQLPPPDYSKPVNIVRLETLAFIINHEQSWDPFKLFRLADAASDDSSRPSWLLDFSFKLPVPPRCRWAPHPSENGPPTVSDDLTVLSFSASNLGPLRIVMVLANTAAGVLQQIRNFLQIDAPPPDRSDQAGAMLLLGIARLCIGASEGDAQFTAAEMADTFRHLLASLCDKGLPDKHEKGSLASLYIEGATKLGGKTVFALEQGTLGVFWHGRDLQNGDIIVIPRQANISFVLRPHMAMGADGAIGKANFTMAGIACLDGMIGELEPAEELVREVSQAPVDRFHIR